MKKVLPTQILNKEVLLKLKTLSIFLTAKFYFILKVVTTLLLSSVHHIMLMLINDYKIII